MQFRYQHKTLEDNFYLPLREINRWIYQANWFSSIYCGLTLRKKAIGYVRSAIEDLAFTSRSSREPGRGGPEDCLSTGMSKRKGWGELG